MIKTRLVKLLSHAKKYIVFQVVWKWISLLCQVVMIYVASMLLESALFDAITKNQLLLYGIVILIAISLRLICDIGAGAIRCDCIGMQLHRCADRKRTHRGRIYFQTVQIKSCNRALRCFPVLYCGGNSRCLLAVKGEPSVFIHGYNWVIRGRPDYRPLVRANGFVGHIFHDTQLPRAVYHTRPGRRIDCDPRRNRPCLRPVLSLRADFCIPSDVPYNVFYIRLKTW